MGSHSVTVRRHELVVAAALALFFGAAPTVGDVGSCGAAPVDLDPQRFALAPKVEDCQRCFECNISDQTCQSACAPNVPSNVGWPSTCHPLQHDGEVCLDALQAATCSAYRGFVSDDAPTLPTECDFCHLIPEAGIVLGDP